MVKVWIIMFTKIIILFSIIILVLFIFRVFNKISSQKNINKEANDEIIDLEKDSKTDEYKPKE